jgi:endonuclease/exonuclease/phosphatase (EEP) superfamily protein YafD
MHLGTPKDVSSAARKAQVAAIVEDTRRAEGPVVVAGDCNARNGVAAAFQAAGFDWVTRNVGRTIAWFSWDHVFIRGLASDTRVRSGAVDSMGASDHRAVWVELPFEPGATRPAARVEPRFVSAPGIDFSIAPPAVTPAAP